MTSVYCGLQDVRDLTGLTTDEISDANLSGIILHASIQLNADIQTKWENEGVTSISTEKENEVDSTNTKYYTRHFPIGDRTNDGIVSGIDVYAYTLDSDGNRVELIASGITTEGTTPASALGGPIWFESAPSDDVTLHFTYYSSPVDMETPHPLVKLATCQLAAALSFTRIDVKKVQSFRVGKVAIMRQSQAYDIYKKQYYSTINRIRQEMFKTETGTKVL